MSIRLDKNQHRRVFFILFISVDSFVQHNAATTSDDTVDSEGNETSSKREGMIERKVEDWEVIERKGIVIGTTGEQELDSVITWYHLKTDHYPIWSQKFRSWDA